VSEESLQWIDSKLMDPSELAPERQEALRSGFRSWAAALPEAPAWKLLFRKSGIGPNAFALPDGTILMTDELVALAEKDEEIYAVLGHELGHIHHRHSMRMVARQTALAVVTTFLFGDLNSIASVVAGLPLFLSQNGYSREFEHEADVYGAHLCVKNLAGMQPMVLILEKLEKAQPSEDMPGWLSTHPHTPERIRHLHEQGE
jgi:Zn-dependent protease with chaperone function